MIATWRHLTLAVCLLSMPACGGGRAQYTPPGFGGGDSHDADTEAGPPADAGSDGADAGPPPGCRDDADGDGVVSPECGGRDCNDADPTIRPRADDPGTWSFEAADELGWAATPSVVVGADGTPAIAFEDRAIDAVILATRGGEQTWARELVEAAAREPALTTDTDGVLHALFVSVAEQGPPSLRHAHRDPDTGWRSAPVVPSTAGRTPRDPALAPPNLNPGEDDLNPGEVVGAYVDAGQQSGIVTFLAREAGGGWTVEAVVGDGGAPETADARVAVAVGQGAVPWLGWTRAGVLRVASRADGSWGIEAIPLPGAAAAPALAVGPDGLVVASVMDVAARALVLARRAPDGAWASEVVDDRDGPGDASAVAVDPAGAVHLLYYVPDRFDARWATDAVGGWLQVTIDRHAESYLALALDPTGAVHMAYATTDSDLGWAMHAGGDGIDQDCSGLPDDGD